jgi:hypothetical protein
MTVIEPLATQAGFHVGAAIRRVSTWGPRFESNSWPRHFCTEGMKLDKRRKGGFFLGVVQKVSFGRHRASGWWVLSR